MRRQTVVAVIALVAITAIIAAVVLRLAGGNGINDSKPPSGSTTTGVPTLRNQDMSKARWEIADVRDGIVVYADNRGAQASAPDIPIGRSVRVTCQARNYSGIVSINVFYLIATPPWRGLFASANQFANGAKVGVTTNANEVDPHVVGCRT